MSTQDIKWRTARPAEPRQSTALSLGTKLVGIWASASLAAFVLVMAIFTLFFGRNKVVLNETIYEGHRFVGQAGKSQLSTQEGYGLTTFGENGLIVNKTLDPKAFRVLFIGDSYVKAKQVSDKFKFTEIVEDDWNAAHPDKPIQTLNLGLGGQSIPTYLSFGRNMDRHFEPDLVFLMLNADDFMNLKRRPKMLKQVASGLAHSDAPPEPMILTKPETANVFQRLINDLGVRSFFGQLQLQTYALLAQESVNDQAKPAASSANLEADATHATTRDPEVNIQLKALQEIWQDRLVILYNAPVYDIGPEAPPQYSDAIIVEMEDLGISYVNLYSPFLQAFQMRKPPKGFSNSMLGQGHLNKYGHTLVAKEIIKFMEMYDVIF